MRRQRGGRGGRPWGKIWRSPLLCVFFLVWFDDGDGEEEEDI